MIIPTMSRLRGLTNILKRLSLAQSKNTSRLLGIAGSVWRYAIFCLSSLLLLYIAWLFWFYPLPKPLFNTPYSSVLLSEDRRLLAAHIATDEQWRFPALHVVPEKFQQSLIYYEDHRFMQHWGVDPLAIARAVYLNLRHGRIISGGSTLSMQVIRLAEGNPPRTFWQKFKESILALRLEQAYSKKDILKLYASHAPFGGNVVGLEAAAWRYFARTPQQLSWAESALLAVLPNSPALIHLGKNRARLLDKRNALLKRLYEYQVIDQLTYELAQQETLPEKPHSLPRLAPHLLETLQKHYPAQRFHSTLDYALQQRLNTIAQHYAQPLQLADIHNLAILVLDNQDFSTLAYIANSPLDSLKTNTHEHGLAIDLIQRVRSTGSTLKPFLFATMLQQGELLPDMLVSDVPVHYAGFMPKNYDRLYRGAIAAKYALAQSLNIPAVNLLSQYGVARFQAFLTQMGINSLHRSAQDYGLSLILGGAEASLWELTQSYANLAHLAQTPLNVNADGTNAKLLFYQQARLLQQDEAQTPRHSELDPATAWMTLQALLDVARPGDAGHWQKFSSSQKIAWKTGTSFGHRDAWAIGTTPRYTIGVWVGNANGEGRSGLTGTQVAAPLLLQAFNALSDQQSFSQTAFQRPKHAFKTIKVCKKDGYLSNGLCESQDYAIPKSVNFTRLTPHHLRVHLDPSGQYQVHSGCEPPHQMQHQTRFILPPAQAYYYQQYHSDYQALPPYRADCQQSTTTDKRFSIIYPAANAQIYLPTELDGSAGKVVLRALAQPSEQRLYWHINQRFIGTTETFHQQALHLNKGKHRLTLVDETGQQQSRVFTVLSQ
jgi:penicillin-binding protein 1C